MRGKHSIAIAVAALALALAGGGIAFGAARVYTGEVIDDPKTSVTLKVRKRDDGRVVKKFEAERFVIECEGDISARLGRATLTGAAKVDGRGRFEIAGEGDEQTLSIEGRLERRSATGVLRYSGTTEFADGRSECRSGPLKWHAVR